MKTHPQSNSGMKFSSPARAAHVCARVDAEARGCQDRAIMSGHAIILIQRLAVCLEEEANALVTDSTIDLGAFAVRKSQGLVEFNRILMGLGGSPYDPLLRNSILALRTNIEKNLLVLRMHLAAVGEISELLADAIRSEDSDGTYSPTIRTLK